VSEVRLSPDGSAITVFVPMAWRRRGGHKAIVAPPGCDDWAPPLQIDRALVKALARAHRWQRMLESGAYTTLADLADAERISRSYVSRVLRLTLLAPDIVERILDGRPTAGLAQFLRPFPSSGRGSGSGCFDPAPMGIGSTAIASPAGRSRMATTPAR
jgi:hypothetical protein